MSTKISEHRLLNGRTLEIHSDELAENPRIAMDNLGLFYHWHPHYRLGEHRVRREDFRNADEVKAWIESQVNVMASLPVFLYDHSGQSVNTTGFSCAWDSGQVGWIVATKESLQRMGHDTDKLTVAQVETWLRGEIETLNEYLMGEVCMMVLRAAPCPHCGSEGEIEESVGGFYGSDIKDNHMLDCLSPEDREFVQSDGCGWSLEANHG